MSTAARRSKREDATTAPVEDKLITHRQVNELLGLRCRTSHVVRGMAARGQIRAVRINERVIRYSEASVRDLIAGRTK